MTRHSTIDFANAVPAGPAQRASDPKAFLSAIGVEIDAETESLLRAKLGSSAGAKQAAAIVHIDA